MTEQVKISRAVLGDIGTWLLGDFLPFRTAGRRAASDNLNLKQNRQYEHYESYINNPLPLSGTYF